MREPLGRGSELNDEGDGALRKAQRFLSIITVLFWQSLVRSAVFSALAALALSSLGLALPTFRYFETSTYAHADFRYEVDHLLTKEAESALIDISEAKA